MSTIPPRAGRSGTPPTEMPPARPVQVGEPTARASRLAAVRGRLSLPTLRRATGLLDGRHRSVFIGHGQDFDDLSAYRPGDDVSDIDWKASARTGQPVIKRYQRETNLPLVLAVDTGRTMAAQAPSGEDKRELALAVAEILAYLARSRGDTVALVAADADRVVSRPPRAGSEHAETLLTLMRRQLAELDPATGEPRVAPASDLTRVLERVSTWHRRRSLVVLITDTSHPDPRREPAVVDWVRRLSSQHELVVVQIEDDVPLAPGRGRTQDVDLPGELPAFLREDPRLAAQVRAEADARRYAVTSLLDARHVEHASIASDATLIDSVAEVLGRQRAAWARRRR